MKRFAVIPLIILLFFSLALADAVILEFSGEPTQDKIVLNWKTGQEEEINLFIIEKSNNNRDFYKIGEIASKGSNSSYEYVDNNLTDVKSIYYYRLKIRRTDETFQFSAPISVIPKVSSFAKTWGSIKALFQ